MARWWLHRLLDETTKIPAADLYAGRAFRQAMMAASHVKAPMYIVSAGLGLVSARRHVPSYDLSVTTSGQASVHARVRHDFDYARWWEAVSAGPFATNVERVGDRCDEGRLLLALTSSYALMVGDALDALPPRIKRRMRLCGAGLNNALPTTLHQYILPYDERLDSIAPGIRADFANRALAHFAAGSNRLRRPAEDLEGDQEWVAQQLRDLPAPVHIQRQRVDDVQLMQHVRRLSRETTSAGAALRIFRRNWGMACEHDRFMDAFRKVTQ